MGRGFVASALLALSCAAPMRQTYTPAQQPPQKAPTTQTVSTNPCDDIVHPSYHGMAFDICATALIPEMHTRLETIADIKQYSQKRLGFVPTNNYVEYVEKKEGPSAVHHIMTVIPPGNLKKEFQSFGDSEAGDHTDKYRFLCAHQPCMIRSEADTYEDEKEALLSAGFSVYLRLAPDFGDNNKLTSAFLIRNQEDYLATLLHEDAHFQFSALHEGGLERTLEESIAEFFGHYGVIAYFKQRGDAALELASRMQYQDWLTYSTMVNGVVDELDAISAKNMSPEKKVEASKEVLARYPAEKLMRCNSQEVDIACLLDDYPYTKYYPLVMQIAEKEQWDMERIAPILLATPPTDKEGVAYLKRHAKK